MENLDERKSALLEKLNSLKSVPTERKSETEFLFVGKCGNKQLIETNLDKDAFGISSDQFMIRTCDCGHHEYLSICVGIGLGCADCAEEEITETKFLWTFEEGDKGVGYGEASTLEELCELANFVLI